MAAVYLFSAIKRKFFTNNNWIFSVIMWQLFDSIELQGANCHWLYISQSSQNLYIVVWNETMFNCKYVNCYYSVDEYLEYRCYLLLRLVLYRLHKEIKLQTCYVYVCFNLHSHWPLGSRLQFSSLQGCLLSLYRCSPRDSFRAHIMSCVLRLSGLRCLPLQFELWACTNRHERCSISLYKIYDSWRPPCQCRY